MNFNRFNRTNHLHLLLYYNLMVRPHPGNIHIKCALFPPRIASTVASRAMDPNSLSSSLQLASDILRSMAADHLCEEWQILLLAELFNWYSITFVYTPHYAKRQFDVFKRLLTRYHLPQNDSPTEYITFLRICRSLKHLCG